MITRSLINDRCRFWHPRKGSQVAEIVFKSYKEEHGVELNAYTGSVVLYIVFALSNWFAPSGIVSLINASN